MDGYVYGPFHSRRLGLSLGINVLGDTKRCTFNCVYCEIGASSGDELVGIDHRLDTTVNIDTFSNEITLPLRNLPEIDSATFGYMGETTLCRQLAPCLDAARSIKATLQRDDGGPVISIFTNATTLGNPATRTILAGCDLVMAKLDCATPDLFKKVNRPHPSVPGVGEVIDNIAALGKLMREEGKGELAIQTLLFRSFNPRIPSNIDDASLNDLASAYNKIRPHKVQLYTVAREPAEKGIFAITPADKVRVRVFMTDRVNGGGTVVHVY